MTVDEARTRRLLIYENEFVSLESCTYTIASARSSFLELFSVSASYREPNSCNCFPSPSSAIHHYSPHPIPAPLISTRHRGNKERMTHHQRLLRLPHRNRLHRTHHPLRRLVPLLIELPPHERPQKARLTRPRRAAYITQKDVPRRAAFAPVGFAGAEFVDAVGEGGGLLPGFCGPGGAVSIRPGPGRTPP